MKHKIIIIGISLLLLLAASVFANENEETVDRYSIWTGLKYTDTSGYAKKVGEYRQLRQEQVIPDFKFSYMALRPNSIFTIDGHYFDKDDAFGKAGIVAGDLFKADFQYRSMTRNMGQDMLENLETREWLGTNPGGKTITHDIQDPDADYEYHRTEILSKVSALLSREHNVRLEVAHRSILKKGHAQAIASNHCFSCHLTSKGREVDEGQHQIEAGINAEAGNLDFGYKFGYRLYQSNSLDPTAYYDPAKHPVNGGSGAEFSSRQNYSDATLTYSAKPKTAKMSHKVRIKGDAGKGRFAGALTYSQAKNKHTFLVSNTWAGVASFAYPMSPKTRLVAKVAGTRIKSDEALVDVASFREGRPAPAAVDFDFVRYSALDRADGKATVEVIHRVNPKATVSVLAGFQRIDRYGFPTLDNEEATTRFIGQAKLNYRKGLRYSSRLKYRLEKTSNPFTSPRGLFEYPGIDSLTRIGTAASNSYFYYQREGIRYQSISTEPTIKHEINWTSSYRPTNKVNLNMGAKFVLDKNSDLDSLDVKHTTMVPNLAVNFMPDPRWTVSAGFNYYYNKSRGPVTVALFDG